MDIASTVYKAAIKNGMPKILATLIVAQSKHESGNYRSNVFLKNNNLFGYKYAGQKIATRGTAAPGNEGTGGAYAKYAKVDDSVTELTDWIKRRQKEKKFPADLTLVNSPEMYAGLLKTAGFYGAPLLTYLNALKKYMGENIAVTAGVSTGVMVAIAAGTFLLSRKK